MDKPANRYQDLTTYSDIYHELVYQRNATIDWLTEHSLLSRNRYVASGECRELEFHAIAKDYRLFFRETLNDLLDRLYSHDAIEALYDFNCVDLSTWSNTEANMLERELQALQDIISKLEVRYNLQYKMTVSYDSPRATLFLNGKEIVSYGQTTLRHRLLTALYSAPNDTWFNDDIAEYFYKNFAYEPDELKDKSIEKTAGDIKRDIAAMSPSPYNQHVV